MNEKSKAISKQRLTVFGQKIRSQQEQVGTNSVKA